MNVLIIGLGSIATKHIYALQQISKNIKIYALRSNSTNKNAIEGVQNIYQLNEVQVQFNFAIIANPTSLHYQTIEMCLALNCALFIEKPLFADTNNSDILFQKVKSQNVKTYIACNLRFHPCIQFVKNYFTQNKTEVNEVNVYCGSYLPNWRPNQNFRECYSANAAMGGGVHLDLIHEIDYCLYIFGQPISYSKNLSNKSTLKISAIDYANYCLEYNNFNISVVLNYYRKIPKRQIEIVFENDIWTVDLLKTTVTNSEGIIIFEQQIDATFTYIQQMNYFINAVQYNKPIMNNIEEAIVTVKIANN